MQSRRKQGDARQRHPNWRWGFESFKTHDSKPADEAAAQLQSPNTDTIRSIALGLRCGRAAIFPQK